MSIEIKQNEKHVLKTAGKYCDCDIVIEPVVETAEILGDVVPKTEDQNIFPDEGYVGIGSIRIKGVTSSIDENITPENIKSGVEILGVKGSYVRPDDTNLIPQNIAKGITIYGVEGTYDFGTAGLTYKLYETVTGSGVFDFAVVTGIGTATDEENIVVSPLYQGRPVKSVGSDAFKKNAKIKTISLPNSIKRISVRAFDGCINLESVSLPEGLEEIATYAFYNCKSLKSISLPQSLKTIDRYAFSYSALSHVVIPSNAKTIKDYAFSFMNGLTEVILTEGITEIKEYTFYDCPHLRHVVIPRTVTNIGHRAFDNSNYTLINMLDFYNESTPLPVIVIDDAIQKGSFGVYANITGSVRILVPSSRQTEFINHEQFKKYASVPIWVKHTYGG